MAPRRAPDPAQPALPIDQPQPITDGSGDNVLYAAILQARFQTHEVLRGGGEFVILDGERIHKAKLIARFNPTRSAKLPEMPKRPS